MAYPRYQLARSFKMKRKVDGDVTIPSGDWADFSNDLDIYIRAQVGDVIEVGLDFFSQEANNTAYIDAACVVSGSPVSWWGSGELTSNTGEGVMGWIIASSQHVAAGASMFKELGPGDIGYDGIVHIRLRCRASGGDRVVRASAENPITFWARNIGPMDDEDE